MLDVGDVGIVQIRRMPDFQSAKNFFDGGFNLRRFHVAVNGENAIVRRGQLFVKRFQTGGFKFGNGFFHAG